MNKYVGIKYVNGGRTEDGLDCYGLVRLFLQENFAIELQNLDRYPESIQDLISIQKQDVMWTEIDIKDIKIGDVLVLRQLRVAAHIGVVDSETSFIHCDEVNGVVREKLTDSKWKRRIVSAHRHRDIDTIKVAVIPSPVRSDRFFTHATAGTKLIDIVNDNVDKELHDYLTIHVMGNKIPREVWETSTIKAGAILTLEVIPKGGNKKVLGAVLGIMATVWSGGAGGTFFAHLLGGKAITGVTLAIGRAVATAVGMLAVNALVPPPSEPFQDKTDESYAYAITGANNRQLQYGAVPSVIGTHRIYPPFASKSYTETDGNDQYLNCIFAASIGDVALSDFRLGDDPITNFSDYELKWGIVSQGLFAETVSETALALRLTPDRDSSQSTLGINDWWTDSSGNPVPAGDWSQRTTSTGVDEFNIDVLFPGGLYFRWDSGHLAPSEAHIEIEAKSSTVGWHSPIQALVELNLVAGGTCTCPDGVYSAVISGGNPQEVGLGYLYAYGGTIISAYMKLKVGYTPSTYGNGYTSAPTITPPASMGSTGANIQPVMQDGWRISERDSSAIRKSMRVSLASSDQWDVRVRQLYPPLAIQGNGFTMDEVSWTAFRDISTSDSPIQVPYTLTRVELRIKATDQLNGDINTFNCIAASGHENPADAYRYLLQGEFNASPVPDSKIDLVKLASWHTFCGNSGFEFNAVLDSFDILSRRMQAITTSGRATYAIPDGLHSVVIDEPQAGEWQFFASENVRSFQGEVYFVEHPHALKCNFFDRGDNWQQRERIVYADGYDKNGFGGNTAASIFEKMQFFGVTDRDHVWKLGRYYLAAGEYQVESWKFLADIEYIACTRGDRIVIQHDTANLGLASSRVKSFGVDWIQLYEEVELESGTDYILTHRSEQGVVVDVDVVPGQVGLTSTFNVSSMPADINKDDLCAVFEESLGHIDAIVTKIHPMAGKEAEITCIPYSSLIYQADQGTIPPYVPPGETTQSINPPRNLTAGEYLYKDDSGTLKLGLSLAWMYPIDTVPDSFTVQMLRPDSSVWEFVANTSRTVFNIENTPAGMYSFRVRTMVGAFVSEWATLVNEELSFTESPPADVTNLQSSYKNGKVVLTWSPVTDTRGVEYEIRKTAWEGGSIISIQTGYEYFPAQDGTFLVKARTIIGGAESINAASVAVDGINSIINIVHEVTEDGTGQYAGSCYHNLDILARNWFGDTEQLPEAGTWELSGTHSLDTDKIKIPVTPAEGFDAKVGYNFNDEDGDYLVMSGKFNMDVYSGATTTNKMSMKGYGKYPGLHLMDVDINSRNSNYEIVFKLSTGDLSVDIANTGDVEIMWILKIETGESELYVDGVLKGTGTAYTSTSGSDQMLHLSCDPQQSNAYIHNMQIGRGAGVDSTYIAKVWSGISDPEDTYPSGMLTGTYTTHPSNILDLGHDDWVIGTVTDLEFFGSDGLTNLLLEDDLLLMDDLFSGATAKVRVQPQIRTKADGASAWGSWQNLINASYHGRYFEVRLQMDCNEGITGYIATFVWSLDMEDRVASANTVSISSSGTAIVFDTAFQESQSPQVTQVNALSGDTVVVSSSSETGFTVQILDSTGTGKSGVISWLVKGY